MPRRSLPSSKVSPEPGPALARISRGENESCREGSKERAFSCPAIVRRHRPISVGTRQAGAILAALGCHDRPSPRQTLANNPCTGFPFAAKSERDRGAAKHTYTHRPPRSAIFSRVNKTIFPHWSLKFKRHSASLNSTRSITIH